MKVDPGTRLAPHGPSAGAASAALSLTAAICTRGGGRPLERALESLVRQRPPPAEILVIDNAAAGDVVRRVAEAYRVVRYIREPIAGLNFARNRALRETGSDIVAFLDDDAVADREWSGALLEVFAEYPHVAACTGRVEALRLETEAQRLFEANGGYSRGTEPVRLPEDSGARKLHGWRAPLIAWAVSVGSGCSLAVRRRVALELGGFDCALDLGDALPGGGDHDMLWRLLGAGHQIVYEPRAVAWHEHRRELDDAFRQIAGHQRALVAFLTKSAVAGPDGTRLGVAVFLTWRLLKPGVRLARRLFGRDQLPAVALVSMWWNAWRGLIAYPRARRTARRRAAAVEATPERPAETWG
jgi:GT2 family glycosyltransferase